MALYTATIIKKNDILATPPMFIREMVISYSAKSIFDAEFKITEYCKYVYPYMKVESVKVSDE